MPDEKLLAHDGWHRLLRLLSEKGLTFSKDRIYAIHGIHIAYLIIELLKVEYFNGVFRPYLAQGLAWNYSPRGPYDTSPDVSVEPRNDRLPTWCWASNGPVQFSDILTGDWHSYIYDVHPHMFPSYPINTNLTNVIDSKLHIKAPIIKVDLIYRPQESIPSLGEVSVDCDGGKPLNNYFWVWLDNQLGSNHSTATNILHNASRDTLLKGSSVQILLIGGRQSHTHYGLLVQEMGNQPQRCYQRYGFIRLSGQNSQCDGDGMRVNKFEDELLEVILP